MKLLTLLSSDPSAWALTPSSPRLSFHSYGSRTHQQALKGTLKLQERGLGFWMGKSLEMVANNEAITFFK